AAGRHDEALHAGRGRGGAGVGGGVPGVCPGVLPPGEHPARDCHLVLEGGPVRCPTCEYPLWNLTARQCPECGRPFLPSEFRFVANGRGFCDPHSRRNYTAAGPAGGLAPPELDCVKGGRHIHMDQMVLQPTEGEKEEQTEWDTLPWTARAKIGSVRGWFA